MSERRSTRGNETLSKIEMAERGVQDAVIAIFLLFTGLIALNVIYMLLYPEQTSAGMDKIIKMNESMAKYVIPWVSALALLIIARELWLMRIYLEGIHIGFELENMLAELKKIEEIERKEEEELEKIEKIEEEMEETLKKTSKKEKEREESRTKGKS